MTPSTAHDKCLTEANTVNGGMPQVELFQPLYVSAEPCQHKIQCRLKLPISSRQSRSPLTLEATQRRQPYICPRLSTTTANARSIQSRLIQWTIPSSIRKMALPQCYYQVRRSCCYSCLARSSTWTWISSDPECQLNPRRMTHSRCETSCHLCNSVSYAH